MGGESGGGPRLNSFNIVPLIMYTCTIDIGKMALTLALLNITVGKIGRTKLQMSHLTAHAEPTGRDYLVSKFTKSNF